VILLSLKKKKKHWKKNKTNIDAGRCSLPLMYKQAGHKKNK